MISSPSRRPGTVTRLAAASGPDKTPVTVPTQTPQVRARVSNYDSDVTPEVLVVVSVILVTTLLLEIHVASLLHTLYMYITHLHT